VEIPMIAADAVTVTKVVFLGNVRSPSKLVLYRYYTGIGINWQRFCKFFGGVSQNHFGLSF
jgi:hypothetical protein